MRVVFAVRAPSIDRNDVNVDRRFLLFSLISGALLVSSLQGSMVSVALPDMIEDLDAPLRWVGWVVTIYSLAQAVSMPISSGSRSVGPWVRPVARK